MGLLKDRSLLLFLMISIMATQLTMKPTTEVVLNLANRARKNQVHQVRAQQTRAQ